MAEFSIIVPVFNCADDLLDCVQSILTQTEPDLELLLIDDGSTDDSGVICEQFAMEDPRVRVFHKSNGGAASARNVGLSNATGEYILFIDGDDTVDSNLLDNMRSLLNEQKPQMVIFGMSFEFYDATEISTRKELFSVGHSGRVQVRDLLSNYSGYFDDNALSSACNKVFSSELIHTHNLRFPEDMTLYEDLVFVLRYLPYCEWITLSNRSYYHYRVMLPPPLVHPRVSHLSLLQDNLDRLVVAVLALDSPAAAQRSADLCAQLYDEHLITARYSISELSPAAEQIRNCHAFTALYQAGFEPSETSSASWQLIRDDRILELYRLLQKRRLKTRLKQLIKLLLKRIGLYR